MKTLFESILSSSGAGKAAMAVADYPIGTILDEHYCYSMSIHTYYQVVGHKGTSTIIFREIEKKWLDGNGWQGHVEPVKDAFVKGSKEIASRITKRGIRVDKYSSLEKWNGTPGYEDHMD